MERTLLIDDGLHDLRAAVIEDGILCEIHRENPGADSDAESLYFGRVQSIRPSLGAAFVDIGEELHAFLPMREDMNLRCGDMLIVQCLARQTTESKGMRISASVNLAGKWLVLLPGDSGIRISKKVKDPALRCALLELGEGMLRPGFGMIIRTASEDVTGELLAAEAENLYALWERIEQKARGMTRPGLLYRKDRLDMRLVRDLRGLSSIVTNSEKGYQALLAAQAQQRIPAETRIEYYMEKTQLLFDAYSVEAQIDKALKKRVWLPCGGYLVIDFCEAMTVIDVNSGKMILGRDLEDTALRVNLEAADEIIRQLRLRDIGGIVIVDFIDMNDAEHRRLLLERMKHAARQDRTQIVMEGMTRLGLMELTRKRIHNPLRRQMRVSCSYCSGSAEVLSCEEVARRALRQVKRMQLSGQRGPFAIRCSSACAQALAVMRLPQGSARVYALPSGGKHAEKFDIEQIGAQTPLPKEAIALEYEE